LYHLVLCCQSPCMYNLTEGGQFVYPGIGRKLLKWRLSLNVWTGLNWLNTGFTGVIV
jgi:hypothetical protein